jgi:hemerythrin-like domain-containing protein
MDYRHQVSNALDDEHRAHLELLGRVEQALARTPRSGASPDAELARIVGALRRHLETEVERHFDFEERELFPRMEDAGDGDLAALLVEEHATIRAVCAELLPLLRQAEEGALPASGWEALRRTALEMVERQVAHIQKETMALLPLLDDLLDDETDRELAFAYAAS